MVHYGRLSQFVKSKCEATVVGSVYRLEAGFPVYLNQGQHIIRGHLLELEIQDALGRLLDEFHGFSIRSPERSLHHKIEIDVTIADGTKARAMVYAINPAKLPKTATLIPDGDWQRDMRENEPMTASLTERQKTYIQKLGASTGRDIVPINLDLYRELLNKGLIVDKGRRLALTRLGQEVFRFLVD